MLHGSARMARSSLEKLSVDTIRTLSMDAVQKANSGHPGTPMALAPVALRALHAGHEPRPTDPTGPTATASCSPRATRRCSCTRSLHLTGYDVPLDDIKDFRQLGSPTPATPSTATRRGRDDDRPARPGHRERGRHGARRAHARRALQPRGPRDRRPPHLRDRHRRRHEGGRRRPRPCSLAGHLGLGHLIAFYDDNHISIEGDTELAFSEDVRKRFEAYGWHVQNLGEDIEPRPPSRRRSTPPGRRRAPVADRRPHPHRARRARTSRTPPAPRRAARRGGDPAHQGDLRLADRAVLRARRGARALPRARRARRGAARPSGSERFDAYRGEYPAEAAELERDAAPASCPTAGTPTCRARARDAGMIATRKASTRHPVGGRRRCPSWSAARPTSRRRPDADRGRRRRRARRLRRAQPALRHPRARHGRDRQRPRAAAASAPSAPRS